MAADNDHTRSLDTATAPATDSERQALESSQFAYRRAVGELIWAMITCRPELAFPVTKLSQYAGKSTLGVLYCTIMYGTGVLYCTVLC